MLGARFLPKILTGKHALDIFKWYLMLIAGQRMTACRSSCSASVLDARFPPKIWTGKHALDI
jgi:hypothetical protein